MKRAILIALVLLVSPTLASAQEGSPGAEKKFSVSTGLGFASSIGPNRLSQSGFLWQLDAQYRLTDSISVGAFMQVVPITGATLFSFAGDARYHFGFLRDNSNEFLSKLTPYAGMGLGLGHAGLDFGNISDNAALISFIAGVEYDLNDNIALASDMRFNVLGGDLFGDSFYYSWQMIGARYRF